MCRGHDCSRIVGSQRSFISQCTDFHFAKYRFSFRKVQIFISQSTDFISQSTDFHFAKYRFHFAKYRFSFRKVQISFRKVQIFISQSTDFISQSTDFHFAKYRFHFAKYRFSFRKVQISFRKVQIFISQSTDFISQSTDFHFAKYRFHFAKYRFHFAKYRFHFVSFRFAKYHFAKYNKPVKISQSTISQSIQRLVTKKSAIEYQAKMNKTVIEQAETLLERSRSAEIVLLDKSLDAIFQRVMNDEGERVNCDLEAARRFLLVENKTLMDKTITEGIGSLETCFSNTSAHQSRAEGKGTSEAIVGLKAEIVLTTRNAEGEQCYEARDYVTVEIRNQQGQDCATKARIQDNKDGSFQISYFPKETGKCDVSVTVNRQQVHGSPFVVTVKHRQYRPVLSFGEQGSNAGMLSTPWGVAVNERDEIAVTDNGNNRVQLFNSDGTYLRSFGRKGDKNGEFNFPCGIGFDKSDNIMVADCNNSRVQCFSEQGEHLNTFSSYGNLDHELKTPHGLSIDSDGNVIVADRFYKLIKIFHPDGQFLRKIGEEGSFTFPFHCVQYENYLFVSDSEKHRLKVFDRDGKFLYTFGKKGERDGEFNKPRCVSVNKAGHLMVCDLRNHRVQVFELSGKFVTKFGTKGSGIGEFNVPLSTAVLSDGRIVVTDFGNDRIQIFK